MQNWWQPENFQQHLVVLRTRNQLVRTIREYFESEDFDEVDTPALQRSPGMEVHLNAFRTKLESPQDIPDVDYYLHTSPEFAMKKLLVAGMEKIFQFAKVFRNKENSNTHHPEFTMLEWYRIECDYRTIMQDCENILKACAKAVKKQKIQWRERQCDILAKWQYLSVQNAFVRYANIDLFSTISLVDNKNKNDSSIQPSSIEYNEAIVYDTQKLKHLAEGSGIYCKDCDSWEDIFFRVFLEQIEPNLGLESPTILFDYPISMAALSQQKKSNPLIAERFELYICGLELANAFSELNDVAIQRKRFQMDQKRKQELYGYSFPIDEDFLAALEYGMPEAAGIALGVDRLAMLLTNSDDIKQVLWVPLQC